MRLLAISGKRFSGKDSFAALLVEGARQLGLALETYAFAGESKRLFVEQQQRAGVEVDLARLTSDRPYKETWRPLLTKFTVEAIAADPLVFCRAVVQRIEASGRPALITDLRLRLELAPGVRVAGDLTGRFRGIVASMVSGRYAALRRW